MNIELSFGRRVPVVLQSESAECGLACIAMIANFHGYEADLGALRVLLPGSQRGVTLLDMIQMGAQLQLSARALRTEPQSLERVRLPCILHWNMDHFVVLEKIRRNQAWINDPAVGRRTLSIEQLSKHFTGVVLELLPTSNFKREKVQSQLTLGDFFRNVRALRPTLFKLFALSIAMQAFAIISPFYVQLVIDQVIAARDVDLLVLLAIGFGCVALLNIAIGAMRSGMVLYFGAHLSFEWATRLFHHLVRLPIAFFERRHMGDVVSRFRSIHPIQQLVTTTIVEAVIDGIMAVTTLAVMLLIDWRLTLLPIGALCGYGVLRWLVYSPQREAAHEALIKGANENTHFLETLRGMLTIKTLSGEQIRETTWQNRMADSVSANLRSAGLAMGQGILNQLMFGIEVTLLTCLGALAIMRGELSVGMLVSFLAFRSQLTSRAGSLIDKVMEYRLASVNLDRLSDIVAAEQEPGLDDKPTIATDKMAGRIEVRNASFRYSPTDPWILDDMSLKIEAGESVAIVGPSGCGKTTLLKIMMGLLAAERGEVLIDGRRIPEWSLKGYRRSIASVMQEDSLLSGSLADNIAFFSQRPDMQRIEQCARLAAVHPDIAKMPMAYLTQVGDMGTALSGGQKQRILLARALYMEPKILFLDEATSHVDPRAEAEIHAALKKLKITRVLIAHRAETIAIADRTVKLWDRGDEVLARLGLQPQPVKV